MQDSIINIILYSDNGVEDGVHERVNKNKEFREASDKSFEVYKKFEQILKEEQLPLFNEFVDLRFEENCIANEQYFKEGVKTGLLLAVECLYN